MKKVTKENCVHNLPDIVLTGMVILMPFAMAGIVLFINGYKFDYNILVPVWNDEVGWWSQANAMIHYGKPLGYIGYNGTHAEVGNWGPWGGAAVFVPYFIFGKIFGWGLNSMAIANMTFLSVALFTFMLLTKPDKNQKIWLLAIYFFMYIMVGYSLTSMSEGLRYSLGIILTGLLVWLERHTHEIYRGGVLAPAEDVVKYVLIVLFICYTIIVYMIFALVVPVFCGLLLRKTKPLLRGMVSFFVTCIAAVLGNYYVSITSAPYTTSTIDNILHLIGENGLYEGFCYILESFFGNLSTMDFPNLISLYAIAPVLFWFFLLYTVFLGSLIYEAIGILREKNFKYGSSFYIFCAFWMLAGFLTGYCMLYTGSE